MKNPLPHVIATRMLNAVKKSGSFIMPYAAFRKLTGRNTHSTGFLIELGEELHRKGLAIVDLDDMHDLALAGTSTRQLGAKTELALFDKETLRKLLPALPAKEIEKAWSGK